MYMFASHIVVSPQVKMLLGEKQDSPGLHKVPYDRSFFADGTILEQLEQPALGL